MAGDLARLIEPALILAPPMQGHGYDAVDAVEHIYSADTHALGELTRERMPSRVLQCMNNLSQCALVFADSSRTRHRRSCRTMRPLAHLEASQGVAAPVAQRRCDGSNRRPAVAADASRDRLIEKTGAHSAAGGKHCGDDRVRDVSHGSTMAMRAPARCARNSCLDLKSGKKLLPQTELSMEVIAIARRPAANREHRSSSPGALRVPLRPRDRRIPITARVHKMREIRG